MPTANWTAASKTGVTVSGYDFENNGSVEQSLGNVLTTPVTYGAGNNDYRVRARFSDASFGQYSNVVMKTGAVAADIMDVNFASLPVGAYTSGDVADVDIIQGDPQITLNNGVNKIDLDGDDVVDLPLLTPALETLTGVEIGLENIIFPTVVNGGYILGGLTADASEGIWIQFPNALGALQINAKIDGTNYDVDSANGLVSAATNYSSIKYTMNNNGADLDLVLLLEDVSIATLTVTGKNLSDLNWNLPLYLGARNFNGISGVISNQLVSRVYAQSL